ncbi:MAG: NAD-dependent epimerase [Bacteroidota bacterium]|nr:NAD-dependent epimerase [Bacteroidota bacterium]
MKILITGTAGFIGFHLANRLMREGHEVIGLDNINDYYDPQLKLDRLSYAGIPVEAIQWDQPVTSATMPYRFYRMNLENSEGVMQVFENERPDAVVNLAAQAGVRYSLTHPEVYLKSNIDGFLSILEACRKFPVKHLLYASSSSVYGLNENMPFSTHDNVDHPISLYAATKKSNELMAHTYSHLFGIPTTGLRFFTVYGPWGRPDMALFLFTRAMLADESIQVFNHGEMKRDFTYVDDIVDGIVRLLPNPPTGNPDWDPKAPDPATARSPYRVSNIGNSQPVMLMDFIKAIEDRLGIVAKKDLLPLQPGDVPATWADVSDLQNDFGYQPQTSVKEGIDRFLDWYLDYYNVG